MIKFYHYFLVTLLSLIACINTVMADQKPGYQYYAPSAEGTGKIFMGREISPVMGYQGASWLERENREKEERTDVLLASLNVQEGWIIADVGAGTGYLSRRLAKNIGARGLLYAVDIQPEMVNKLTAISKNYPNIKPILSKSDNVNLPENVLDMAILVDVYHELEYPYEVIQTIIRALKPHAKLVLVEYRAEDNRVPIKDTHKMTEAQVVKELTVHALTWEKTINTLPWQHVIIFSKK